MTKPLVRLLLLALPLTVTTGCGGSGGEEEGPDRDLYRARARVAALFVEENNQAALAEARALADREGAAAEDLVHAGILAFELGLLDDAQGYLLRAEAADPDSPRVQYLLGKVLEELGELEAAKERFERTYALVPDDFPTRLSLANVLSDLDELEAAEGHYRALVERDVEEVGGWLGSAVYRLGRLLIRRGEMEAGQELLARKTELEEAGHELPSNTALRRGNLGSIEFPDPIGTAAAPAEGIGPYAAGAALEGLPGGARVEVRYLVDRWSDARQDDTGATMEPDRVGLPDVVSWGPQGVHVATPGDGGAWSSRRVLEGAVELARWIDVDNDGRLDLAAVVDGDFGLWMQGADGTFARGSFATPELPSTPSDLHAVDFDHEGDLDLVLAGPFGARLWRNDGLAAPDGVDAGGAYTDATAEGGLPTDRAFAWCLPEDLDVDQDVDLLFGGPGGVFLADSLRGGVFADRSADLGGSLAAAHPPSVSDFTGDGRPDLWFAGEALLRSREDGRFDREADDRGRPADAPAVLGDQDLDGAVDAVWLAGGSLAGRLALGLPGEAPLAVLGELPGGLDAAAFGDLDGDGDPDLVAASGGAVARYANEDRARGLRVALMGDKDNERGVGATIEVVAGSVYRRVYSRGEPVVLGLGGALSADVLRVTWPNGVVQHVLDAPVGEDVVVRQVERLAGSCPFLYTWNGESFEFVSDVLGITPLGLPMAPGMLVPPDHDEYVLVTGEQLKPREQGGRTWLEMQVTEELREVTYLDQARLLVVDHPEGTELFPNELFKFPPFPERHEHVVRDPLAPVEARGGGRDWARELAAIDEVYAKPFRGLEGQYQGLAEPYTLEVAFDPARIPADGRLRLLCTGWLLWSNASVNVAAARTPGVEFLPPLLQVPDAEGGWRDTGPPVGFPAGKTKTMVLDVTELLDREDPRLRLVSTLCLHWDAIRLAIGGDEPTRITELEAASARLWERGFSKSVNPSGEYKLEWFLWDELEPEPPWNQHPGLYTRFGETQPLVADVDDRFVVMGAGDALHLRFDATDVPPLEEGWTRDYLVFLDGWAKDRDPNAVDVLEVEPFPFHGMSGYPYGADEAFPDTEAHRAWRREWQTRPARTWIEPLTFP